MNKKFRIKIGTHNLVDKIQIIKTINNYRSTKYIKLIYFLHLKQR